MTSHRHIIKQESEAVISESQLQVCVVVRGKLVDYPLDFIDGEVLPAVLPSAALTLIPQPRKGRAETTVSADKSSAVSRLVSFLFMFYCLPFLSDPEVTRVATCGYVLGVSTG